MGQYRLDFLKMQFFVLLSVVSADIVAETYAHEEPVETAEIAAEAYVHEEIEAEPYHAAAVQYISAPAQPADPVTYTYAAAHVAAAAPVAAAHIAYPYAAPYAYAAFHTGCVNSVGSIVPCA